MLIAHKIQKLCEKWEQPKCINGDLATAYLSVPYEDSCVGLLPLTLSVVSLSLLCIANCPLPLASRTPNVQMHQTLLLIEVEFVCKLWTMQNSNEHMQIHVTYTERVVLAKNEPNKCVTFFCRGLPRARGRGGLQNVCEFFFRWPLAFRSSYSGVL